MARFAVLFTVSFLLFTFSYARFITVDPEHDTTTKETDSDLPESDPKTTTSMLLPTEGSGFGPAKVVDSNHVDDASKNELDVDSIPLTMIPFHPVNRHFPRRPMIPFRHKHNCGFHKRFRPLNPRFQQNRYISYGDDMILSDGRTRFHPESNGAARQIQARWARFPDDDGADSKEQEDIMKPHDHDRENEHDVDFTIPQDHDSEHDHEHVHHHDHDDDDHHHHHHHRRHHHHGEEGEGDEEDEHGHEHEGGFMKRLSKFFNNF